MTPHTILPEDFPIYKGAKWEHILTVQTPAGAAVDLTGLGPFVMHFDKQNGAFLVAATCVVGTPASAGLVTVSLTAAQTLLLPLGAVNCGLRDAYNNPYAVGLVPVRVFPPTPA